MKTLLIGLILVHGFIHLFGYSKVLILASKRTTIPSNINRSIWLLTTLLFLTSAILLYLNNVNWLLICSAAMLISQILIIAAWRDAKYGTIGNLLIFVLSVMSYIFL